LDKRCKNNNTINNKNKNIIIFVTINVINFPQLSIFAILFQEIVNKIRDLLIKLNALNEHECLSYFVAYAFKVRNLDFKTHFS